MTDSTVSIKIWWVPDILIAHKDEYLSANTDGHIVLRNIASLSENKRLPISGGLRSGLDWDGYNTQSHSAENSIDWPPFDPPTIQATFLITRACFSHITFTEQSMKDKLNVCEICT
ncbi:MAG: hypothetical protein AAGF87_18420 [Bacteroidota bacterium]